MKFSRWWRAALFLGVALLVLLVPLPATSQPSSERIYHINASRFAYDPPIVRVNPGDQVTIELEAMDVVHGLSIDGYNLAATADPGQVARLTFVADHSGTFRFHCTVTCGNLHPFMTGKLEVGRNDLFWRAFGLLGLAIFVGVWFGRP